jgi:aspartate 1-decarboxylase
MTTRKMMRAKIHRATVTQADVHYEGSITIDRRLMDATDLLPNEAVCVWNVTNGNRFETYVVEGPADSGVICVNGAAAHLVLPGDLVIIAAFTWMDEDAARRHEPKVVFVDERNRMREKRAEVPGPWVSGGGTEGTGAPALRATPRAPVPLGFRAAE